MDAYHVLVIILASVLALVLVVLLIAGIMMIFILKQLKHIAEKAASVADNVEVASEFFKNTSMTGAAVKLFSNATQLFRHHKRDKKGDK